MICHSIQPSPSACLHVFIQCICVCVHLYLFLVRFFHSGRLKMLLHICWHFKFQTIIPIPLFVGLTATAMPTSTAAPLSFIADCSFTRSTNNKTTPTTEVWEEERALWPSRCQPFGSSRLAINRRSSCSCALFSHAVQTERKRVKYKGILRGDLDKVRTTTTAAEQSRSVGCWQCTAFNTHTQRERTHNCRCVFIWLICFQSCKEILRNLSNAASQQCAVVVVVVVYV